MEIMSGLIASGSIASSNPAYLASHGSPTAFATSTSPTFPYPASPRSPLVTQSSPLLETDRESALEALEGRTPSAADENKTFAWPESSDTFVTSIANKRASWSNNAASAMAAQGGKGAVCLGALVEEEEEEEEEEEPAARVAAAVSNGSPGRRQRPASLLLPLSSRPFASSSTSPASSVSTNITTPSEASSTVSTFAKRPLSLSVGPSSTSIDSTKLLKQQRRQSGLRSLTLAAATNPVSPASSEATSSTFSPIRRGSISTTSPSVGRSFSSSSSSMSSVSNARSKRSSSILASKKGNSSISYRNQAGQAVQQQQTYTFGTTEGYSFANDDSAPDAFGSLVMEEEEESKEAAVALAQKERAHLESQLSTVQAEAVKLRSELAETRASLASLQAASDRDLSDLQSRSGEETRHLHLQIFELQNDLGTKTTELAALAETQKLELERLALESAEIKERLSDTELERDELADDVEGWRNRCGDLQKAVERERSRFEEEHREALSTREKLRKLGDRLANTNGATSAGNEDVALATAQAKLIGEMRDQIFALAGALEREKREHARTQASLEDSRAQHQLTMQYDLGRSHSDSDASASTLGRSCASSLSGNVTEMTDDTSFSTTDSCYNLSANCSSTDLSLGASTATPLTALNLGGLHTLAEEDEEEEEQIEQAIEIDVEQPIEGDSAAWVDEDEEEVPELDFQGVETGPNAEKALSNAGSSVDETLPKTPVRETPEPTSHRRSDSFIKQWTFPKGPVKPLHIVLPDDHSFFQISAAEVLPALPLTPLALEMPPFFDSDLVVDENEARKSFDSMHSRRPSSPRDRISPVRTSFSALPGPPPSRSARYSSTLSVSSTGSYSAPAATAVSRMSLQGISSLISSTFAAVPTPAVGTAAKVAANLCHAREESIFEEDHQALLAAEVTPVSTPRAVSSKTKQIRPVASPLSKLDFTKACGVPQRKVIMV